MCIRDRFYKVISLIFIIKIRKLMKLEEGIIYVPMVYVSWSG